VTAPESATEGNAPSLPPPCGHDARTRSEREHEAIERLCQQLRKKLDEMRVSFFNEAIESGPIELHPERTDEPFHSFEGHRQDFVNQLFGALDIITMIEGATEELVEIEFRSRYQKAKS
jgi:hypothetical protein